MSFRATETSSRLGRAASHQPQRRGLPEGVSEIKKNNRLRLILSSSSSVRSRSSAPRVHRAIRLPPRHLSRLRSVTISRCNSKSGKLKKNKSRCRGAGSPPWQALSKWAATPSHSSSSRSSKTKAGARLEMKPFTASSQDSCQSSSNN